MRRKVKLERVVLLGILIVGIPTLVINTCYEVFFKAGTTNKENVVNVQKYNEDIVIKECPPATFYEEDNENSYYEAISYASLYEESSVYPMMNGAGDVVGWGVQ